MVTQEKNNVDHFTPGIKSLIIAASSNAFSSMELLGEGGRERDFNLYDIKATSTLTTVKEIVPFSTHS